MTANLLALQQVSLQLGRSPRFLLKDINFELQTGESVALLGNPGSGKTLLLQLLNGLRSPSQGHVHWQGQALASVSPITLRQQIAWLPQQPRLLGMTGKEAIAYPLKLQGLNSKQIQQRLDHWLETLQLPLPWLEQTEEELSQPAAQAIALTRALAMAPKLLLLDNPWPDSLGQTLNGATEPLSASPSSSLPAWETPQNQIDQALKQFTQAGGTVLWTMTAQSKFNAEVINRFQRLLCIRQGQLFTDSPATATTWHQALDDMNKHLPSHSSPSDSDEWDD